MLKTSFALLCALSLSAMLAACNTNGGIPAAPFQGTQTPTPTPSPSPTASAGAGAIRTHHARAIGKVLHPQ